MWIYKKGDVDIKGIGTTQKEKPTTVPTAKLEESMVCSHMLPALLQTNKGKSLAKKINVHIEHVKPSKNWDSFLKHVKENDQKKEGSQSKRYLGSTETQAAPPREMQALVLHLWEPWKGAWAVGTHSL